MVYRYLADVVMIVHFGFILFVALGAILAWRWRRLIWAHLLSVGWGVGIAFLGFDCPLTPLERNLRQRGGEQGYEEGWGFVDAYIEGVIYPAGYTPHLRALAAVLIAIGWSRLLWLRFGRRPRPGPGEDEAPADSPGAADRPADRVEPPAGTMPGGERDERDERGAPASDESSRSGSPFA